MDRNTFTGLFLILVIFVGSTFLLKPSEQEINKEKALQDSIAKVKSGATVSKPAPNKEVVKIDSAALKGAFGSATIGTNAYSTLENEHLVIKIANKGGRIYNVLVKNQQTYDGKPIYLFDGDDNKFGLNFVAGGKNISTNNLYFTPQPNADKSKLTMRLIYADGKYIDYIYALKPGSYKLDYQIAINGLNTDISESTGVKLNWESILPKQEKDITNERLYSSTFYKTAAGDVDKLSETSDEEKTVEEKLNWVSFKQHFFSSVLIAKNGFSKAYFKETTPIDGNFVKSLKADITLPYTNASSVNFPMQFYFGPNKFSLLESQGDDIEKQINLGWGPLKWINRYAVLPVFNFLNTFNFNYGIIILILTIILKLVLFPLTYKSYQSMAKMRVLKPEMDEIKKKVGDDNPTLLQQEYLKLYKQAGVNPLGGCLPLLFQMPIIIAFFYFFPNLFELRQESFLWMKDLSTYDDFFKLGFTLPFLGSHISLMCILMTISTLIYTYFNNQVSGATGQMKYIGYITPIIFFGVLNSYPSGLNYYYFCANILTFTQQYIIRMFVNDDKIHAKIQDNKKKPASEKKQSKFQAKLQEMMRQQQIQQQKKGK